MSISNYKYLPVLALSPAEMVAIEELPSKDKDTILPLVLLKGWVASGRLSKSIERINKAIGDRAWIADIDESFIEGKKNKDGQYPREVFKEIEDLLNEHNGYENWIRFLSAMNNVIPTLRYRDTSSSATLINQMNRLIELGRGVAVRFCMKTIEPNTFNEVVTALKECKYNDMIIILDYGDIDRSILVEVDDNSQLIKKLSSILSGSIFAISSSSFPNSFSGSYRGEIPIYERQFYNKVTKSNTQVEFIYSDHGSARAEKRKGGGGTPPPRIDYPLKNDWRFVRKEPVGDTAEERKALYQEAAIEVIDSDYWEPMLALWGTRMIEQTSKGDEYGITNPNRATAVRINIHMYLQLHYLDTFNEMDTDEEWFD